MIDPTLEPATDKNCEMPVVPSVLGDPTLDPRIELLPSSAVRVRKSRLVYQRPTTLCGDANVIVTVASTGSQTTMDPE